MDARNSTLPQMARKKANEVIADAAQLNYAFCAWKRMIEYGGVFNISIYTTSSL
jgi:hypothetical protein